MSCCADKKCTPLTCMWLPEGHTCGTCAHFPRCSWLISTKPERTDCDWFPRRYHPGHIITGLIHIAGGEAR